MIKNCGGEWKLTNDSGQGKHSTIQRAHLLLGKDLGMTFTIVRNPWDRMVSGFLYYKRKNRFRNENITFEQFIRSKNWYSLGTSQARFFPTRYMDHVLRFENLDNDFKIIQNYFGVYEGLSKQNVGGRDDSYQDYYTPDLIDIVAQRHYKDIQRFGYTFD